MKVTRRQIRNLIKEEFSTLYEQSCDAGQCEIPQETMTPEHVEAAKRDTASTIAMLIQTGDTEADAVEMSGWNDSWPDEDWKEWLPEGQLRESPRRTLRREILKLLREQGDAEAPDERAALMTNERAKAAKQLILWLAKRKINPNVTKTVRQTWEAREGAESFGDLAFFIVNHDSDPDWVEMQEGVLAALNQYHNSGGEPYPDGILGGLERWFDQMWTLPQSSGGYGKQLKGSPAVTKP